MEPPGEAGGIAPPFLSTASPSILYFDMNLSKVGTVPKQPTLAVPAASLGMIQQE